MFHFTYWLEHFKELPPAKVQTIIKTTTLLSEKTASICSPALKLLDCDSLSAYRRTRQAIMRKLSSELNAAEKRALTLFGDYLEFREYSHYNFLEEPSPLLVEYCKSMQMSYSYKAVLIMELSKCDFSGVSSEALADRMIAYYQNRKDAGLIVEKEGSVFSKPQFSVAAARRTILTNPVQVLSEAKIITWNKKTGVISFTNEYAPRSIAHQEAVCKVCIERLNHYYASVKTKCGGFPESENSSKNLNELLSQMAQEIEGMSSGSAKENLFNIHRSLCKLLDVPASAKRAISLTDSRKVGRLVQECMAVLEEDQYNFPVDQLENMQSLQWSNSKLKLNYAFLKLIDETLPIQEQRRDHLGNSRYYTKTYTLCGRKYLLTSQWYEKCKLPFIEWFNNLF